MATSGPHEKVTDPVLLQGLSSSQESESQMQSTPTPKKIGPPKEKSFKEVLESNIRANIAFGLTDKNTPENLNIFGKLFNVTTQVTLDEIQGIIDENEKKLKEFRSRKTDVNSRSDSGEEQKQSGRSMLGFSFGSKIRGAVNAATPSRVEAGQSQNGTESQSKAAPSTASVSAATVTPSPSSPPSTQRPPPYRAQSIFHYDELLAPPLSREARLAKARSDKPAKLFDDDNVDPLGGLPVIDSKGGKRKRTIKRKHRSIRYNTLRSKK